MADRRSGVRWQSNASPTVVRESLRVKSESLRDDIADVVEIGMEEGAQVMRDVITIEDRVATGTMRNEVDHKVDRHSTVVKGKYGWLNPTEDYYVHQDQGFRNWRSQEYIEGMHATMTAAEQVSQSMAAYFDMLGLKRRSPVKEFGDSGYRL